MNHLEQLIAEWYEYNGYFVRRNVLVDKRERGGYECELDVVAFNPQTIHLVHVEPSLDAESWPKREARYSRKFEAGRRHIPRLFRGLEVPTEVEQIAVFGLASNRNRKELAGGRVATTEEFMVEIVRGIRGKRVANHAVPEQFPLLRTIQYCIEYETHLFNIDTRRATLDLTFEPFVKKRSKFGSGPLPLSLLREEKGRSPAHHTAYVGPLTLSPLCLETTTYFFRKICT